MLYLLADVWNSIINTCFRDIDPTARGFIIVGLLLCMFFVLAKSINLGSSSTDRPIHIGRFILFLALLGILILYAIF